MSVTIEALFAVVIVGMVFLLAVSSVNDMVYVSLLYHDEMRNVSRTVLNTILFDQGYPYDWGSTEAFDEREVKRFGLASSESRYILNYDKVARLVNDNPLGSISYRRVKELLSLKEFGFRLRIFSPLSILHNRTMEHKEGTVHYCYFVKVSNNEGRPIARALVTVYVVSSHYAGGNDYITHTSKFQNFTDAVGVAIVSFELEESISDFVTVVYVEVGGFRNLVAWYGNVEPINVTTINVVGNSIVLTHPKSEPNDDRWIESIEVVTISYGKVGVVNIYNGTKEDMLNYGAFQIWNKTFPILHSIEPILIIANMNCVEKEEGRQGTLVLGVYPTYIGYRVVEFGGEPRGKTARLQRVVTVNRLSYVAEFLMWKE